MNGRLILVLLCGAVLAAMAPGWAQSRERLLVYRVERIERAQAPTLDGKLDEAVWQHKGRITNLRNFRGQRVGDVASQTSEFTLLTDGQQLYLGATFFDESMGTLLFDPSKAPFWNDCIELYFDPRHDGTRSIQLVVDCGGQRMWQRMFDDGYGWWDDTAWYMLANWDSAVSRGPDAWSVEIRLDCQSFGFDPVPGKVVGFNACRFRLSKPEQQEFSAWGYNAANGQKGMPAWGHLLFGAAGQAMKGLPVTRADVTLIYPKLGAKTIEVPVEGGLTLYTAETEETKTFKQLLTPVMEAATQAIDQAKAEIAELPNGVPEAAALRTQATALERSITTLLQSLNEPDMTMGAFDRLSDQFANTREDSHNLLWKAKFTRLLND